MGSSAPMSWLPFIALGAAALVAVVVVAVWLSNRGDRD